MLGLSLLQASSILITAVYLLFVIVVKYTDYIGLPPKFDFWGPILMYKTEKGIIALETIADKYRRFWDYLGLVGSSITVLLSIGTFVGITYMMITLIQNPPESGVTSPQNYLVIPGVNDFLPLAVAFEILVALGIGMIIHEGGHAIYSRLADMEIESMGVIFFAIIPIGAFVEPEEGEQEKAEKYARLKMTSAGIVNNLIITVVAIVLLFAFGLLFSPVVGAGVGGVFEQTPAADSGIQSGDVITQVNGTEVANSDELEELLNTTEENQVVLQTSGGDEVTIDRQLTIERNTENSALSEDTVSSGTRIVAVDGTELQTIAELESYIQSEHTGNTIEFTTVEGDTVTIPLGGAAVVQQDGIDTNNLLEQRDSVVITSVNSETVKSGEQVVTEFQDSESPQITYTTGEDSFTTTITDTNNLFVYSGYSGLQFTDVGLSYYPTDTYFDLINPIDADTDISRWLLLFFIAPFATLAGLRYNFFGLAGDSVNYFIGVAQSVDPLLFIIWNILYWTAWININLAIFNCLPTAFVDGGYIITDAIDIILEKIRYPEHELGAKHISRAIKIIAGVSLLGIIIIPSL